MPAMLGCNTVCPNCKHEFTCCVSAPPPTRTCSLRRSLRALTGGGLVTNLATPTSPCPSPQVSPSAPLAFVMPPFNTPFQLAPPPIDVKPETDIQRLTDTVRVLRLSGWYYEGVTFDQINELLKGTPVGTFIVRNSSDPRFLFSLSVQTERGPTSVRLFYINGYFRLDAQPHLQSAMPIFPSVLELIEHYVNQSRINRNNTAQVWVDPQGKWYSPILLVEPLRKEKPPSLKHLARLAVHKALKNSIQPRLSLLPAPHTQLELPVSLTAYLAEYPHSL